MEVLAVVDESLIGTPGWMAYDVIEGDSCSPDMENMFAETVGNQLL